MNLRVARSDELAALVLFLTAVACAGVLFWLPRNVAPVELPSLRLSRSEVDAVLREDAQAAKGAPANAKTAALDVLFLEQGRIERVGTEEPASYTKRRNAIVSQYKELTSELGEATALRLRARAMQRFEAAFDMRMPQAKAEAVLGSMHSILDRDGASRDGYVTAPRFAVRTMYKARWNLLHGLRADDHFARVERRSFFGWEALQIERLPLAQRAEALHKYQRAGGTRVPEAWGVLTFRGGQWQEAADALALAYRETPSLRVRNYERGARHLANSTKGEKP